jgi:hypothetical protein
LHGYDLATEVFDAAVLIAQGAASGQSDAAPKSLFPGDVFGGFKVTGITP